MAGNETGLTSGTDWLALVAIVLTLAVAIAPRVAEWWFDFRRRPVHMSVVGRIVRVNPASEALIRLRVKNRLRYTVTVQLSYVRGPGYDTLFEDPRLTLFPGNTSAQGFEVPGHDIREIELRMKAKGPIGATSIRPWLIPNRFNALSLVLAEIPLEATQDVSA